MNAQNLLQLLHRAALEHDSCTGECNNDHVYFLELAVQLLEDNGLLGRYIDMLRSQFGDHTEYYSFLLPAEGYVTVEDSEETQLLFDHCKLKGARLAAGAIQNSGDIPMSDIQDAMDSIADPGLAHWYSEYVKKRLVRGKDQRRENTH